MGSKGNVFPQNPNRPVYGFGQRSFYHCQNWSDSRRPLQSREARGVGHVVYIQRTWKQQVYLILLFLFTPFQYVASLFGYGCQASLSWIPIIFLFMFAIYILAIQQTFSHNRQAHVAPVTTKAQYWNIGCNKDKAQQRGCSHKASLCWTKIFIEVYYDG